MARSRLNTRLVSRLVMGLALLALIVWIAHAVQQRRHAAGQLALADRAEADGDTKELIAALGRYLGFRPSDTATRARYGLVLASAASSPRDRTRALQVLQQVLARDPAHMDARIKAAELAAGLGDPADALRLLGPALDRRPGDVPLLLLHARLLQDAGRDIQAADALEAALAREPGRVPEAVRLAELLHSRLRQPRQAERVLGRMVENATSRPAALLERGRFRAAHGQPGEAADDFRAAIKEDGKNADLRLAWADLCGARGDIDTSAENYREAARLAPHRAEAHLGLAWAERERGKPDAADDALLAGLARIKDHPGLLLALAETRIARGKLDEASAARKRLPADAKGAGLYLDGLALLARKDWLGAARALADAVQGDTLPPPIAARALLALCKAYVALEAPEERLLAARHAQFLADTPPARLERAAAALDVGLAGEALVQTRHLVSLPRFPAAAWLLHARALVEQNAGLPDWQRRWAEAEAALARAEPADAVAVLRARMLELRGEPAEARAVLEKRLADGPPEAWLALADLESRHGTASDEARVLAKGDAKFGTAPGWLVMRASQLAGRGTPAAQRDLDGLLGKAKALPAPARARVEWHVLGLHLRGGRLSQAEGIAATLAERFPADLRLQLLIAEARIQALDFGGAKGRIARMKEMEGAAGVYWRVAEAERLLALARRGEKSHAPEARKLLDEARAGEAGWARPWLVLARLEEMEGRPAEALAAYRKVLDAGDWGYEPLNRSLALLLAADRHAEADELIERAQRRGVLATPLLRPAAYIALRAGRAERARDLARKAVPQGTKSYRDLVWLGRLLDGSGQPLEAEAALREALALAPDAVGPWLALARVQRRNRHPDEADRTLARMLGEVAEGRRKVAEARGHELMGRLAEAEACLKSFLRATPGDVEASRRLADLLMRLGRPADAEPILVGLLNKNPRVMAEEKPELRRQLALAVSSSPARVPEALALLKPNAGREADRRTESLVRGMDAANRGEALRALAGLASGQGVLPEEMARLAHLHGLAGDWPGARDILLDLAGRDPDNPAYPAELADGLLRDGKRAEARSWLERLEKLDKAHPRLGALRKLAEGEGP